MLEEYLEKKKELLDKKITEYFDELEYPPLLLEGMKYSVLNGGKRLRPGLLLMVLELLHRNIKFGVPTAISIELIHSYSLYHSIENQLHIFPIFHDIFYNSTMFSNI